MSNVISVSDDTFENDVIKSNTPVLVDFWAEWCGPCKMLSPVLDQISEEYKGKLKIVKVNVDDNNDTAARFGIRGIPSLLLFKNGNLVDTKVGSLPKSQIVSFINDNI